MGGDALPVMISLRWFPAIFSGLVALPAFGGLPDATLAHQIMAGLTDTAVARATHRPADSGYGIAFPSR